MSIGENVTTLVSAERGNAFLDAVRHVHYAGIPGDIVECGVWKGGLLAAAASLCVEIGADRTVHGFDLFTKMPPPTEADNGQKIPPHTYDLAPNPIEDVHALMRQTGCKYQLIQGDVIQTTKQWDGRPVSVLRLDVDWSEATTACLQNLYPHLTRGGVILVDDYGHWPSCRSAVDKYFSDAGITPMWFWQDYTGVASVKT